MTTGAHDAGGFTKSAGANAIRGVMVIAAAVVVGVLLMGRGLSDTNIEAVAAEKAETTVPEDDGNGADSTSPPTSESTTTTESVPDVPDLRDPSQVAALVLNAAEGKPGIAGRGTDILKPLGYLTLKPENATVDGPTAFLFAEGYAAEAAAVAEAFGLDPTTYVKPLDAANPPVEDTQDAKVIVIIGNDGAIDI
jgi:hypothetical protein